MDTLKISDLIQQSKNDFLRQRLEEDPDLANKETEQGISYLLFAAYCRNSEAVEMIRRRKEHVTAYEGAAIGDLEVVCQRLEEEPSLLNEASSDGFSLLGLCCFFGHYDLSRYLIKAGADINQPSLNDFKVAPIHSACAGNHMEIVRLLVDHGVDVNASQMSGVTPLHTAAHLGSVDLANVLLAAGADVRATTEKGETPKDLALVDGHQQVAQLLDL